MSDEAPEKADIAIRAYIGAAAFCCVLIGAEMMADKEGTRFWIGAGLAVLGLPLYLSAAIWRAIKTKLNTDVLRSLNYVATDARWWVLVLMVLLGAFAATPFIDLSRGTVIWAAIIGAWAASALAIIFSIQTAAQSAPPPTGLIVSAGTAPVPPPRNLQVEQDLLHLLDFGVYQTTLVMLSHLVDRVPAIYDVDYVAPLPLELANTEAQNSAEIYMQSVRRHVCDGSDRAARYMSALQDAKVEAVSAIKRTPPDKRPEGIDPLALMDYAVAFRQAVRTAGFLRNEKRDIEEKVIHQRGTMIERFQSRQR